VPSRASDIAAALRRLGVEGALALERADPQREAVCCVIRRHGSDVGTRLAVLNALVSYMLAGRGEEHWHYFCLYFLRREVSDVCRDFVEYMTSSPYLKIGAGARVRRALKACSYRPDLESPLKTLWELSALLGADPRQKTLLFAVKVLNYAYACVKGVERVLPFEIPIPVDFRVAWMSWCSGLLDLPPREALRRREAVQAAWDLVARMSGIPPLHLDTVLWLAARAVLYGEDPPGVPREVVEALGWRCPGREGGDARSLATLET
jgi:DNA-(apurinic or apyrimidinic site) lyase